jgi:hypothetical protein
MIFTPLWGFVTLSTPAALCLGPAIIVGIVVASFSPSAVYPRLWLGALAVVYAIAWTTDVVDRRHHRDVVSLHDVWVADAMPDDTTGRHSRDLPVERITGVLVRTVDHHCVVAVHTGDGIDGASEINGAEVFELDATRRLATRRGRRTTGIIAATIASTIGRPVLGYFA